MSSEPATVVGIFPTEAAAAAAAAALTSRDPQVCQRLVFLISDDTSPEYLDTLEEALTAQGAHVLRENMEEERAVILFLTCQAPDAAAAQSIQGELKAYFDTPYYMDVRAPWEPATDPDDADRSARIQATIQIMQEAFQRTIEHPEVRALMAKMLSPAHMMNMLVNKYAQQRHLAELNALSAKVRSAIIEQLAAERGVDLDESTLTLFFARDGMFGAPDMAQFEELRHLAYDFSPSPLSASYGDVEIDGRQLELIFIAFARIALGLPAFLTYLEAKGCTEFDYRLEDFDDVRAD
jgi:hypothetical protein